MTFKIDGHYYIDQMAPTTLHEVISNTHEIIHSSSDMYLQYDYLLKKWSNTPSGGCARSDDDEFKHRLFWFFVHSN